VVFIGGYADHSQLISQILNFPSGKKDILNALAYSNRVFAGEPVYSDFSEANIFSGYEVPRNAKLLLACNCDNNVTTVLLCCSDGQYITVLADWVSPLLPMDIIPDIVTLIRSAYPGKQVTAWVPADIFDQVGRNPLVIALKNSKLTSNRSEYAVVSRGSLSPLIRTTMRGRRMLLVEKNAKETLHALCMGYNFPIKTSGETTKDPEKNASKTLIEALESLTYFVNKQQNEVEYTSNAVNATGTPYRSALNRN
jgi:hypothetical protein